MTPAGAPWRSGRSLTLGTAVPEFAREHDLQLVSLAVMPNSLWEPAECPLCASGVPIDPV